MLKGSADARGQKYKEQKSALPLASTVGDGGFEETQAVPALNQPDRRSMPEHRKNRRRVAGGAPTFVGLLPGLKPRKDGTPDSLEELCRESEAAGGAKQPPQSAVPKLPALGVPGAAAVPPGSASPKPPARDRGPR